MPDPTTGLLNTHDRCSRVGHQILTVHLCYCQHLQATHLWFTGGTDELPVSLTSHEFGPFSDQFRFVPELVLHQIAEWKARGLVS